MSEENQNINPDESQILYLKVKTIPIISDSITKVTGMYKDWFLDYASYVILERAVPAIEDGLNQFNAVSCIP